MCGNEGILICHLVFWNVEWKFYLAKSNIDVPKTKIDNIN